MRLSGLRREQAVHLGLVKANHDLIADDDDGHTHLLRFLNHLFGFLPVSRHIVFGEGDTFLRKILFRPMAVRSGGGSINDHVFSRHYSPHFIVSIKYRRRGLIFGANLLTYQRITTCRAGSHQHSLALRTRTGSRRFKPASRTDIFDVLHQTTS